MNGFKVSRIVAVAAFLALTTGVAQAQTAAALPSSPLQTAPSLFSMATAAPDVAKIPAFSNMVKNGAKLYYLGERSGLMGWFIIKDGQIQMIYLSPDKQTVVIGGMFTAGGEDVTTPQITSLVERNADVKALLDGSAQQQREVYQAGQDGGAASVAAGKETGPSEINKLPSTALSPGERLVFDLKAAAGVVLGNNEQTELYMVAAPGCPNCKKTWLELRDSVKQGKIQVRIIPVYNSAGDAEKNAAAQLLRVADPLSAWDRFVGGDASALAGTPEATALRAVTENLGLVAKWNIQGYPYLVYRGRDGRIKIVQGKPERMAAVLSDLIH